jgi:gamma-glutamylcyclotransferase (GGCT)/AIG2-like uncharacterized protein YtfP
MRKIAVYGSLRADMYNHRLLENDGAEFVSRETLNVPFKMIPYSSFPALIPDNKNNDILMEIYNVDDQVYAMVETLEGYPHFYDKATTIDANGDPVEFYIIRDDSGILQNRYENDETIYDWNQYYKSHLAR